MAPIQIARVCLFVFSVSRESGDRLSINDADLNLIGRHLVGLIHRGRHLLHLAQRLSFLAFPHTERRRHTHDAPRKDEDGDPGQRALDRVAHIGSLFHTESRIKRLAHSSRFPSGVALEDSNGLDFQTRSGPHSEIEGAFKRSRFVKGPHRSGPRLPGRLFPDARVRVFHPHRLDLDAARDIR